MEVVRHPGLRAGDALGVIGEAEAGTDRVVDVEHVGPPAPGVRVEDARGAVAVREDGADRPVDLEEAEERRRARPALQPHDDRGLGSLLLLLYTQGRVKEGELS